MLFERTLASASLNATNGNDSFTVLLLHGDGTDGATTFTDSSQSSHTVTANGNAQVDTAQSKFGTASALFDGSGDYLSIPWSTDFDFDGVDFTIDFWMRADSATGGSENHTLFGDNSGSADNWDFMIFLGSTTGEIRVMQNTTVILSGSTNYFDDTWHHVAVVRGGSTNYLFVDGSLITSNTTSLLAWDNGASRTIGNAVDDGGVRWGFDGHIDEFRLSKGVARWTAAFTPPTASYS